MPTEKHNIRITVNDRTYAGSVEPRLLLVDFLRHECGLTGTHVGCAHGVCGACTVLMDGVSVRSCLTFAIQADNSEIMTVEGLADRGSLNVLQRAFYENHALQCGYCTPGFLMSLTEFLRETPSPSDAEIRERLSGNLCRCTGYANIVLAVQAAVKERQKGKGEQ